MNQKGTLHSLLLSALCQVIGYSLGVISLIYLKSEPLALVIHVLAAAVTSVFLGLPMVWQFFNFLVPTCLPLLVGVNLPNWSLGLLAGFALLLYIPTLWTQVPYYPTTKPMYPLLLDKLPKDKPFKFIDLGCGFGTLLYYLAKRRPLGEFVGVEISPLAFFLAKLRSIFLGSNNIQFRFQSFWNLDLSNYDYVYAFLAPAPMPRLWEKAKHEMKQDATFITNTFVVDNQPKEVDESHDQHNCKLYTHQFRTNKDGSNSN